MTVNLIQTQLSALLDQVVEITTVGTFTSKDEAIDFLTKRNYKYDSVRKAYYVGNTVQYPVTLEIIERNIFDIRSFT
mgnify:CR=1 FL=1|jgi:hypothetical protein